MESEYQPVLDSEAKKWALILHCRGAYTASDNAPARKEGVAIRDATIVVTYDMS